MLYMQDYVNLPNTSVNTSCKGQPICLIHLLLVSRAAMFQLFLTANNAPDITSLISVYRFCQSHANVFRRRE
jgi:hypothetical protein